MTDSLSPDCLSFVHRPDANATSLTLLEKARARDPRAWERVFKLYSPLIRRWCASAGVGPDDAEDLVQEVFGTVVDRLPTFHRGPDVGSFRGWLRTITRHKVGDLIRHRRAHPAASGGNGALEQTPVDLPPESDGDVRDERRELARRALSLIRAEFSDETWQAFWAVAVDGRAPAAVADELGVSRNVVYLARSRVLRRLREEFAEDLELADAGHHFLTDPCNRAG
jgi:RNA polymerase sigma-70 factor (ECF subfamily)